MDNLDIIRAYAFKEDFEEMTRRWVNIQNKCISIRGKVKYSRKELFYQYFICCINEQLEYNLTKSLTDKYIIKEQAYVGGIKYSKGTVVWNMFDDEGFYADLLSNLDAYLDFMIETTSKEQPDDQFKKYFFESNGNKCDSTKISNAFTIINSILRNDDVVPKMMILKYYLVAIKGENIEKNIYDTIYYIDIIATLFTASKKGKGSEQIANKLIQKNWADEIKELAIRMLGELSISTDFSKIFKINKKTTIESGQYLAKRYYSLCDSYKMVDGALCINEEVHKKLNSSSAPFNMEHFIINRDYKYSLYENDEAIITISCPKSIRKYIATIANYIVLDNEVNRALKNRPVYYKIKMLEEEIKESGIDRVIPSKRSQYHYFQIRKIFFTNTKFPYEKLEKASTKKEKKDLLTSYYNKFFTEEFTELARNMDSREFLFEMESHELLLDMGFTLNDNGYELEMDAEISRIYAVILEKDELINLSVEVYNPFYGNESLNLDEAKSRYDEILDSVHVAFYDKYRRYPEVVSSDEYGGSEDESYEFSYSVKANRNNIQKFIDTVFYVCKKVFF